jgi:hypothetical protein
MEDIYQLTVEQVNHDSQILFSQYSLFFLTSYVFWTFHEAVVREYWIYSGNSVQIFGPFLSVNSCIRAECIAVSLYGVVIGFEKVKWRCHLIVKESKKRICREKFNCKMAH